MKHNGIKPSSQPRSLRSIAEGNAGSFPDTVEQLEPPAYDEAAATSTSAPPQPTDKQPFANLRS